MQFDLLAFICVQGIVTGFLLWRLHRREAARDKREEARKQYDFLLIKGMGASLALAEATAKAVQQLPVKCNGDMSQALEYARQVKRDQKEFLQKQGIENLR